MTSGRHARSTGRPGVTLIEVLVAVAVVGALALLALAALGAAREAARRSGCSNNLRQLGIALNTYASAINIYPQGNNGNGYSLHCMLLPYLENQPLFNSINYSISVYREDEYGAPNATAARSQLTVFLCPSDSPGGPSETGRTSYAGNRGCGVTKYGYNGAFAVEWDGPIGFKNFTDGLSHTASLAEWVLGTDETPPRDLRKATWDTPPLLRPGEFDRFIAACQAVTPQTAARGDLGKGSSWLPGEFSYTLYNHANRINGNSCENGGLVQEGAWSAGSLHAHGANVLFADGRVAFLRDTLAPELWRAYGSRNGREVVPDPAQ